MLALTLPRTETSVLQNTVETRPKATAEWLDRLPFASPVESAQKLVMALYALNRCTLGIDERHTLLALYRPVVARAVASLETLLAESGVPPRAQQRQTGVVLRELLIEHSIGYKHLILARDNRRFGRNPDGRMAEVTARLLATQRDILTACYLTYSPPPEGIWLDMHQLYQHALATGTADVAVDDAPPAGLAYRQALLLALADPPRMSHDELAHTRLYLDAFGKLATLESARTDPDLLGFAVPVNSDHGPDHQPANPTEGSLWLDTDALRRHLHQAALRLSSGDSVRRIGLPLGMSGRPSLTLFKRLLRLWHNSTPRAFMRYSTPGSAVQMVAGISAIHQLLELGPQAAERDAGNDDTLLIHGIGTGLAAPAAVYPSQWTIGNDSAAGLAMEGAPDAPLNLKVGDALALQSDASAPWSLAVIRWIKMRDARQVELGVERLSPQMEPLWVRPLRGQLKTSPEPALFVPGNPALKQPDRLLLPRHLYQIGMDAEVWHARRQTTLTFGRRVEHTSSFDLIDFTLFADEPTQP